MAEAVKVGPWGPQGGQPRDINAGRMPQRLKSIKVSWAPDNGRINGFFFIYVDQDDQPREAGPWGMIDEDHAAIIAIRPGEQLNLLSGTFDNNDGVTSLKLGTNQAVYGPYGIQAGTAFSVPLQTGAGEVVAFFGSINALGALNALGVYVLGMNGLPVMIGPWGGVSNIYINPPVQLTSVKVYSTQRIHGLSFTYVDQNNNVIPIGPWGAADRPPRALPIGPGEYIKNINGTFDANGVTSLQFTTNRDNITMYGHRSGIFFSVPLPDNAVVGNMNRNGTVLGFFGRSGGDGIALGVYVGVAPEA